jgi:hypothetical protein
MHALLQKSGLVLQDAQSYYLISLTARAHGERFLKDGFNLQTTPNLRQFLNEVCFGMVDIAMIPALRPASIPNSPEARAHRLGDPLTNSLDKVAMPFSTLVLEGLDAYFGGANFEVLELLERVVI